MGNRACGPGWTAELSVVNHLMGRLIELNTLFDNRVLLVSLVACFLAQGIKFFVDVVQQRKVNFRVLFGSGGMPSSHSALVTALAVGVGQTLGWDSPEFAIALIFAIIVMYDAAGVRQAAGKQARILNQMMDEFFQTHGFSEERLIELLGHTPFQVIVGALLGAVISWFAVPV